MALLNLPPLPLQDIKDFPYSVQEWLRNIGKYLSALDGATESENLGVFRRSETRDFLRPLVNPDSQSILINQIFGG